MNANSPRARDVTVYEYPATDPKLQVAGNQLLVQLGRPQEKTAGGIIKLAETTEIEQYRVVEAKVLQEGPFVGLMRGGEKAWPHAWCKVGDRVMIPVTTAQRFRRIADDGTEVVMQIIFGDQILATVTD